ncbi:MAG: thioredoxin domain-containing protein, partial [Pirellulaceae bacterium]|nr:thioredoxin domain-containing protein [Pirellulaceae bacterium]
CIKVDREERPDVDTIYMTSLHVYNQLSGSGRGGGWPLSMFLTPEGQPFFGGTYFPARDGDRGASTGFSSLLQRVHEIWSANAEKVEADAEMITRYVKEQLESRQPVALTPIDEKVQQKVLAALEEQFDADYGGFGYQPTNPMRPKFPEPSNLVFLIEYAKRTRDEEAIQLLSVTLERMAMGGIRDHLGGGFHRYSVDRFWRIPHFEKMLYDNGQLASVYADAHLLTGREDFKRVTDEMLTFVLREMTDERGGFYSALDAESENEEGKFYRWTKDELKEALSDDEFELFAAVYGINDEPNFEEHYYAPQYSKALAVTAASMKIDESELDARLVPIREKLFDIRAARPRPLTDTKILTGWNGLMIRGFAVAGTNFNNAAYIQAAGDAATFVLDELLTEDGRLLRTYGRGQAKLNAYVDDYAFMIDGLIALHDATQDRKWLDAADALMAKQIELFWDEANGGFFYTSNDHETLLARGKNPVDGARPSGGSVSAQNLVALGSRLERPEYLAMAERSIQAISGLLERAPAAAPRMVAAVVQWLEATAKP